MQQHMSERPQKEHLLISDENSSCPKYDCQIKFVIFSLLYLSLKPWCYAQKRKLHNCLRNCSNKVCSVTNISEV